MASSKNNTQGTMIEPSPNAVDVVLACLRHEMTYEVAAQKLGISVNEIQELETRFITGGTTALEPSDNNFTDVTTNSRTDETEIKTVHNQISQMGALNAISQSLSAILTLDELLNTTLETLHWVFGYIPSIGVIEGSDVVMKGGYALNGTEINWFDWHLPVATKRNIIAWAARHGRPLNVPDTAVDNRYFHQEAVGDVHSELAIPMMSKGTVLGVLDVDSDELNSFDALDQKYLHELLSYLTF